MTDTTVRSFFESARRGFDWMVTHQRPDGSFCNPEDGIGGYYKVPYALTLAGHLREAHRLLSWVAEHHFTAEGDFRAAERKAHGTGHDAWPVYSNAWLVLGAHRAGRWDLSRRGATFLQRYQVRAGGFYALDGETRFLEPVCTAWGGLAALTTGDIDVAHRAGDLLTRVAERQPDPNRFYFRMGTEGNLTTEVPAGEELFYYVDTTRREQIYFNPGIALIFLTHLYRATGEAQYLEASRTLFSFTQRCADDVHRFPPSGKLGMGSALLYAITGTQETRQAAVSVGTYLVETQTSEGFWRLPDVAAYKAIADKDGFEIRLDITAEFSIFLMEIAALI
jgi:hypothetical protein